MLNPLQLWLAKIELREQILNAQGKAVGYATGSPLHIWMVKK